jgi:hypothetical protein
MKTQRKKSPTGASDRMGSAQSSISSNSKLLCCNAFRLLVEASINENAEVKVRQPKSDFGLLTPPIFDTT